MSITYFNGNIFVNILSDGTKIRIYEGDAKPCFPESMDVKITNYCDMSHICVYCHEMSTRQGKHGNLNKFLEKINDLPPGVEVAIGGGNPLAHPEIEYFLQKLYEKGIIANLTVNELHIKKYANYIKYLHNNNLIKGIGISYRLGKVYECEKLLEFNDNIVWHIIMGVNNINDFKKIYQNSLSKKVLLLGYKTFGFGENYLEKFPNKVHNNINEWKQMLPSYFNDTVSISFDNLGVEQFNLKNMLSEDDWDKSYMGNDGEFTMYFDCVDNYFSMTSTSSITYNVDSVYNVSEAFDIIRDEFVNNNS